MKGFHCNTQTHIQMLFSPHIVRFGQFSLLVGQRIEKLLKQKMNNNSFHLKQFFTNTRDHRPSKKSFQRVIKEPHFFTICNGTGIRRGAKKPKRNDTEKKWNFLPRYITKIAFKYTNINIEIERWRECWSNDNHEKEKKSKCRRGKSNPNRNE